MDLRSLPDQLSSSQRIAQRRTLIERELKLDLGHTTPRDEVIGESEKKNCEQMFGVVPVPLGYAGPLKVIFSNNQTAEVHLPLATTEGALVASINRGCKAAGPVTVSKSADHGITRTIVLGVKSQKPTVNSSSIDTIIFAIRTHEAKWKTIAEGTSDHLKVLSYDIDVSKQYVFLTTAFDTDEAMGMNMATIASQAMADWFTKHIPGAECITIAGNVDSDKKASRRTHERGRGFEVICSTQLSLSTIESILKSTPEAMLKVADAKLKHGSTLAGAIGKNLHAANIIAALYLATGQDAAHVVEGSLTDTTVEKTGDGLKVEVRVPAILVGVRGGGTGLPSQSQALSLLLKNRTGLPAKKQLAETIAAAVLAGEISLLAAQASHHLAGAHQKLAR